VNWSIWSQEAVALMQHRNVEWQNAFELRDAAFEWNLERGVLEFADADRLVVADICIVGTTSNHEGTFLWGWANEALPAQVVEGLHKVREFGIANDLGLLTESEFTAGRSEAQECAAIAGRIQDAEGLFMHEAGDLTMFFTLSGFREESVA